MNHIITLPDRRTLQMAKFGVPADLITQRPDLRNKELILEASGANIEPQYIEIGEKAYLSGHTSGIRQEAWDAITDTTVFGVMSDSKHDCVLVQEFLEGPEYALDVVSSKVSRAQECNEAYKAISAAQLSLGIVK